MLCLWLLTGLVHGCLSGGLYTASPASTVEAHGPLARLALHGHVTPLHHVPAAPAVYQVPAVAQAPVLKYSTQPSYVQRLVDVADTRVAVAKLQLRRPAVQKHFYDIEERTIVRPVGSAVLELEEPVSKQFVSPFSVVPSGHHTVAQFHRPLLYPAGSYPQVSYGHFQVPLQYYPSAAQHYPIISQQPQQVQLVSQPPQQYPLPSDSSQQVPATPQLPQKPANVKPRPPQQFQPVSQPPQQFPLPSDPSQQVPSTPQFPQQPANVEPRPPQQFQFGSQPSPGDSSNAEFDSSDSVVVDNPDFTRSSKPNDEPQEDKKNEDSFDEFEREVLRTVEQERTEQERINQNIVRDFENLQLLRMFSTQTGNEKFLERYQQRPNFQVLLDPPRVQEEPQQTQKKPTENTQSFQRSKETGSGSQVATQTENSIETSSGSTSLRPSTSTERDLPPLYRSYLDYLQDDAKRHQSMGEVISSRRYSSPEEQQENQRKLLELLTGRGEVSEVALTRSGGSLVRGRVLSVTPAPCSEGEEQVNTRRVVVSRPVHTVEEVDVQRPFTQVQRVAVHEPVHNLTPLIYH